MVLCPDCGKEMEEGIFVNRAIGAGSFTQAYWCKNEGFFKIEDKVSISSAIAGSGGKQNPAFICKKCRNLLIKYEKPDENTKRSYHRAHY